MSTIPTVDQAAAQVAARDADPYDTPELRAARAFEPLLDDAYRRAGLHRRTPQDVARDLAASRRRAAEADMRAAERETDLALAYALARTGRTGAL
ncbi:hypothetical protein GCM10027261_14320 [Geodermatophilus arenarius]|uniref:Uncharacterized protein n=1 Tax=Geodermatophilus arenarius TaxID=1137990 RepID=A0ABV9LH89_9ACTN